MNTGNAGAQAERRSAEHRRRHQVALQIGALARRSISRTLRQPAQVVPSLAFPLLLLAINAAGLGKATEIPGFPTDSYLTFALAVPFIQAGIFSVNNSGSDLARDVETGFLDRLALTPMSGVSLVTGQLAGVGVLGLIQGVIYLVVGLLAGADFEAGLAGVPVLLALALAISFAFGCIGIFAALRLGNGEAVQGLFPVLFVFLFLSSMALPRDLIEQDWFQTVATYNPVSYLIEGVRSLFVDGFDGEALALGFGFSLAIGLAFLAAASATLRTRLTRT
ncbi:MAG: ABC transporter permease [Actinomycetota bacterium]|nr:ABC transporter permease [Actinomycetota bacterium]MDQ3648394.1 ABC transporter permease [Actinomycetota bacterium]